MILRESSLACSGFSRAVAVETADGTRSNADHFEQQHFVLRVEGPRVIFDYRARHKELLEDITPADVVWTCRLLDRITDRGPRSVCLNVTDLARRDSGAAVHLLEQCLLLFAAWDR